MACERKYKEKFRFWYSGVCAILYIKMNVIIMFIYRYIDAFSIVIPIGANGAWQAYVIIEGIEPSEWERGGERRDKTAIFKHNTFKKKKRRRKYYFYLHFQLEDDNTVFPLSRSPLVCVLYIYTYIYIIVKQSKKKIQHLGGTPLFFRCMDMISVTIFIYYGGW